MTRNRKHWEIIEPGWWQYHSGIATICNEGHGGQQKWYAYIGESLSVGPYRTALAAMEKTESVLRAALRGEGEE